MARRRMIDPNFWASQDVRKLTYRQRLLAIGLFSIADDEGRGIAHPAYIRSQVFPYDDISVQEVADDLAVIGKYLSIKFYEVGEDKYYAWLNWGKWQRVDKPQKSIIPEPPGQSSGAGQELFRNDSGASQESVQNHSGMSTESGENQSGSILSERKGREGKGREGGREEKVSRESVKNDSGMNLDGMILDAPATARPSLIQTFERDFGRPLSPTEYEQVQKWQENHPPDVVREALRRAVLNGKFNFRYIDRILLSWEKANLRTLREVLEYEQKVVQLRLERHSPSTRDSPIEETAREVQRQAKEQAELISAAVTNIRLTLGDNPPRRKAEEIARSYGDETLVSAILEKVYNGGAP